MKNTSSKATTTTTTKPVAAAALVNILKRICYFNHFFRGIFAYIYRYIVICQIKIEGKKQAQTSIFFACSSTVIIILFHIFFCCCFFLLAKVCLLTNHYFLRFSLPYIRLYSFRLSLKSIYKSSQTTCVRFCCYCYCCCHCWVKLFRFSCVLVCVCVEIGFLLC